MSNFTYEDFISIHRNHQQASQSRDTIPLNRHFIYVKISLFLAQTPAESISIPLQAQKNSFQID
jgi:hypothetical protein